MSIFKTVANSKLQFIFITVAALLFIASGVWGFFSGVANGRSTATYKNVEAVYQALQYYHKDQGRYPSQDQYVNKRILTVFYLKDMPKPEDASGICKQYTDFIYSQPDPRSFQLLFCLTQGVKGLSAGPHVLTDQGVY